MADFYHRLSYSFGNEDWITEHKALRIQPSDCVLCITASGDRPLNLLLSDCKEVTSIDANPIQNALLNLKCVALKHLSNEEYLAFLGLLPHKNRLAVFEKLQPLLREDAAAYWNRRKTAIGKGVLFEGVIEKWILRLSKVLKILRRKKVKRLFAFNDIQAQAEFVKSKWDGFAWKAAFSVALNPWLTRLFIKDPGLYEHVDTSIHIGDYIRSRLENSLTLHLAKSIPLLSLIFQGKVEKEGLPPYLTQEGADVMRSRVERIRWETMDLVSYLKGQKDNSFDCFSLSDVASYISKKEFTELSYEIVRTARPGARFCIRQFLSCHSIPEPLKDSFNREVTLEKELEKLDKCFVYRFTVGKVKK